MKSPFDSEQDECMGESVLKDVETNDIDLAFNESDEYQKQIQ